MFIEFPEADYRIQGLDEVKLPDMVTVRQCFDASRIENAPATLKEQLEDLPEHGRFDGKRIAITVGSRGIPHLVEIVRTICNTLKEWGAEPFVVPSMGSHAGATAQGQLDMLAGLGITPESLGVPVLSSMEVVRYGEFDGVPLYCDRNATEADGIVIFNKVKPHTDFHGPHESGLVKMIAIGIAKHKGAAAVHSLGFSRFGEVLPKIAEKFLAAMPVVFGVGVVQNAYDDICALEVCEPEDLIECDGRLLQCAVERTPRFLFDHVDLLIIDEVGKNISGHGHDPNVTGRNLSGSFSSALDLKKLFVRSITPESHHNGSGIADADIVTRDLLNGIDWGSTWTNTLTTGMTNGAKIPLYANTEEDAVRIALRTCLGADCEKARVAWIKNTLELETIKVSKPLYESIRDVEGISYVAGPEPMRFDGAGTLLS